MTIDMGATVFCDGGCGATHYVGELNPSHFADQGRLTDLARGDAANFGWLLVHTSDYTVCVDKLACIGPALEDARYPDDDGPVRATDTTELPLGAANKADLARRVLRAMLRIKTTDCAPAELPFSFDRGDVAAWIEGAWPHVGPMTTQIGAAVVEMVQDLQLNEQSSVNLKLPGRRRYIYTTVAGVDYGAL